MMTKENENENSEDLDWALMALIALTWNQDEVMVDKLRQMVAKLPSW